MCVHAHSTIHIFTMESGGMWSDVRAKWWDVRTYVSCYIEALIHTLDAKWSDVRAKWWDVRAQWLDVVGCARICPLFYGCTHPHSVTHARARTHTHTHYARTPRHTPRHTPTHTHSRPCIYTRWKVVGCACKVVGWAYTHARPSYIRAFARASDHVLFYHRDALILSYYIHALIQMSDVRVYGWSSVRGGNV